MDILKNSSENLKEKGMKGLSRNVSIMLRNQMKSGKFNVEVLFDDN